MKKLFLLIVLLLSISTYAQSYSFSITGKIQTEKEKTPIEAATIHLEKAKDSSIISYTISDDKGNFSLEGKSFHKKTKLYISFIGMNSFSKTINLDKTSTVNLGAISLKEESNLLNEVVIKSRAPITIKKDTLEFNVKSFKTRKDANVEDLLKKLPGVEVDEEGQITVNGKPVNKILVNGKPFFGNDPSITTKNLAKEIIEKVQITDTKSKSEAFSGEKGDANNKTINLTIKKENNKGWFGRVSAGGGTDDRYEGATMVNRFDNNTRFSVLASANNINSPGFSFGEIQKMFSSGASQFRNSSFRGGSGIITSRTAGATYADEYKKGLDVNADYFYSGSNAVDVSKSNREFTLPDRRYFTNTNSNSDNENHNHNINAEVDIEIDSTFLINVSPSFVFNKRQSIFNRSEESRNENQTLTNDFNSNSFSTFDAKNFRNRIDITKRIGSKGSFIKASIQNQVDQSDGEDFNKSTLNIYGNNPSSEVRDQKSTIDNDLNSIRSRISYRIPLIAKTLFIDAKYNYQRDERTNSNNTFDFDTSNQEYSNFNFDLSSNFSYNDISKIKSVDIVYNVKKWRFNFEVGQINRTLENVDVLRPNLSLERSFNNLAIDGSFRYRFDSKASIYLDYTLDNNAPSINQLQPFSNVSNPSNIVTGNPNLKPSQNHRLYLNFNKFNWQKRTGFFMYMGGTLTNDQIVSNVSINDDLVRTSTFENADGAYNFFGGANYNKNIKLDSITSINFRLGARINGNRSVTILNNIDNIAETLSSTPSFGFDFNWNKIVSIQPRYDITFSNTKYNVNKSLNQSFTSHRFRIRTKTNVPKKLEWRNDVNYTYNPNVIGFNRSAWFWNSTLAYSVFKDKATITLKAYDVLNQNTNARRVATLNYIEDAESTVLQQYFMLGFSWKFNSLGSKGKIREYRYH